MQKSANIKNSLIRIICDTDKSRAYKVRRIKKNMYKKGNVLLK